MQEGGVKTGGSEASRVCYRIRKEMRADAGKGSQPVDAGLRSCLQGLGLYLGVIKQHPPKGPRRSLPGLIE